MIGTNLRAAEQAAEELLAGWARLHMDEGRNRVINQASLDSAMAPPPLPPDFAVGYGVETRGRPRVAVRTAARGKRLRNARALVANMRRQDVAIDFRVIPQPVILPGHLDGDALGRVAQVIGHCRPLHLGCSVSHENGPAGTLGAFVRAAGQLGVLSCSHVLALSGDANAGDNICQPASEDQGLPIAGNRIGKLGQKFAPLVAGTKDNLDAAMAMLSDAEAAALGNVIPDIDIPGACAIPVNLRDRPLAKVGSVVAQPPHIRVAKIGRTSGYTEGVLSVPRLINFTPNLSRKGVVRKYTFLDVIEIQSVVAERPFAGGGDSGSLVFTLPDLVPLGLHFCSLPLPGEPSLNYVVPLERICAKLTLEVL